MKKLILTTTFLLLLSSLSFLFTSCGTSSRDETRLLVFSKTDGFRHASIAAGKTALLKLGAEQGFLIDTTEDASLFTEENLKRYSTIIFLNTTKNVLDHRQQADFERYIQAGGGWVGIHAATDTEYNWPWYGKLAGAYFKSHPSRPNVLEGKMNIVNHDHPSTAFLQGENEWIRTDEFYNYKDIYHGTGEADEIIPLITIDESSYKGGENGDFHPMSWYHEFDGGRAFYTNFGHTNETFEEPKFLQHLLGGIKYAIGENLELDYAKAHSIRVPDDNRFVMTVLDENLNEPGELVIRKDGTILFTQRRGEIMKYDPVSRQTTEIAKLDVYTEKEDGLVGMALDPNYESNNWIYLYYSPPTKEPKFQLSRFDLVDDKLQMDSEKIMLEVVVQRQECCHTGGSIEFDKEGNLYLSTGDDTNPFETRYAPINELDGRNPWDAQKSSANTKDLRGKVLRIKPTADGGYEIPTGNLFPPDGSQGRPEIYVMGCRNPYRISIDSKTGYLYWGDVGPDGQVDSTRGPKGYDEINQARKPGFFGWPLFIGDNKAYRDVDFATQTLKEYFDPIHPVNNSPNNTGIQQLPPAQKAFIWYPYSASKEFPIVGQGGRNAMAGPVYYTDDFPNNPDRFPDYYDGKLFIYDFMRDWIFAVSMNDEGDLQTIEPFLPDLKLSSPMDMVFGEDGALYMLEYGTQWFTRNQDARLIKIDYSASNRPPIAKAAADKIVGAAPLTVAFNASESFDYDGDESLSFNWTFSESSQDTKSGESVSYTYTEPGLYKASLKVTDESGGESIDEIAIQVGNSPPEISIELEGNRSFFWKGRKIPYEVKLNDQEDGSIENGKISEEAVAITFDFLDNTMDNTEGAQGHEAVANASMKAQGEELITEAGCIACHGIENAVVGPSYQQVAEKYKGDPKATTHLIQKILKGGGGVWGEVVMPAQAQLSQTQTENVVAYILGLGDEKEKVQSLPAKGILTTDQHTGKGSNSSYQFTVTYKDKGGDVIGPLRSTETFTLISPRLEAENLERKGSFEFNINEQGNKTVARLRENGYLKYPSLDFTDVKSVQFQYSAIPPSTIVELRIGGTDGKLVESWEVPPTGGNDNFKTQTLAMPKISGLHDLYLVAKSSTAEVANSGNMVRIDWIEFNF